MNRIYKNVPVYDDLPNQQTVYLRDVYVIGEMDTGEKVYSFYDADPDAIYLMFKYCGNRYLARQ